jgi:hypothetical protein
MLVIDTEDIEDYIDDEVIREMFPNSFKEIPSYGHQSYYRDNNPIEMDSELGLEVVKKPTIYEKYGITLDPDNTFHASVQRFFDKNGFITPKQLNCFN